MNPSRFAVGLVGLALAGLWYFSGGAHPLPASHAADAPRVSPPLAHANLSVYFVTGPDTVPDAKVLTLQEALEREVAVVHETSDVNTLAVENRSSEYELFIQSGDIVKGGKQDRMAATDMLLPPKSGVVPMAAHCVEQGRWTGRGGEDARRFATSVKCAVGSDMKYANATLQQGGVWKSVSENQGKLNANLQTTVNAAVSPTSFQLSLESPELQAKVAEYEAALKAVGYDRGNVIGVVFAVNGRVTGAEVYGSRALFRKAWPKLLNAAAVEAVADYTDRATATPPTAREIERFLARAADPAGASGGASPNPAGGEMVVANFANFSRNPVLFQADERQVMVPPNAAARTMFDPEPNAALLNPVANPIVPAVDGVIASGSGTAVVQQPTPLPAPRGAATAIPAQGLDNVVVREPPPVNVAGNRLNSNRTESRSTLVVESRDPARENAVIHRSYIKK